MPAIQLATQAAAVALAELQKRKPLPIGPYLGSADAQVNVQASLGAENIGIWVAQIVYGANLAQGVRYWSHFPNDHFVMKFLVAFLMLVDFLGVVCYLRLMYFWDVLSWGNEYALTVLDWSFFADVLMTGLVPTVVQWYFVWRVYAVSGKTARIMPAIIVLCSIMQLAFCNTVLIGIWFGGTPDKIGDWLWAVYAWFIPGAMGDALITINMLYYLRKAKKTSDFARTRGILNKFVVLVFETNAVTFIGALSILVVFATTNHISLAYNALTYVVTKTYVLSLLLATNLRISLRETEQTGQSAMELSGSGEHHRKMAGMSRGASQWGPTQSFNATRSYGERSYDARTANPNNFAQAVKVTTVATVEREESAYGEKGTSPYTSPYGEKTMDIGYHNVRPAHDNGDELHYAA